MTDTRELLQQKRVADATFAAATQRYGTQGVIDLTATVGYYSLMACLLNALEVIPPPEATQLPK
jgi:4-carboxymuconolactone decarboxylase